MCKNLDYSLNQSINRFNANTNCYISDDSVVLQPVNPYSQFIGGNNMPPVSVHMTPQAVAQPTAVQSHEVAAVIAKELLENGENQSLNSII